MNDKILQILIEKTGEDCFVVKYNKNGVVDLKNEQIAVIRYLDEMIDAMLLGNNDMVYRDNVVTISIRPK